MLISATKSQSQIKKLTVHIRQSHTQVAISHRQDPILTLRHLQPKRQGSSRLERFFQI
jgi:hypothetical protein